MAAITETEATKVSTEAAEAFVDSYYAALNGARKTLATYYIPPKVIAERPYPHISYNGELVKSGADFQERFDKEMPFTYFEPQSVNAHVLNPVIEPRAEDDKQSKKDAVRNMSIAVQVSGFVRLEERKQGPLRGFSDSFVLLPKKDDGLGGGKAKGEQKRWVIMSQHFRFVV